MNEQAPGRFKPEICVWETTLACNAKCIHCGSSAGQKRDDELSTDEAFDLIEQLRELGCQSITLSGGEPLLRADWPEIARKIKDSSIQLEMITNGLLVEKQAHMIAEAGFFGVTFSIDGTRRTHDEIRDVISGFDTLIAGARILRAEGIRIGAVTQINKKNINELDAIHGLLMEEDFQGWQLQITMAHGRARQCTQDLCISPQELLHVEEKIVELKAKFPDFFVQAADNIGYMSRHEPKIRTGVGRPNSFWSGCYAGLGVVGITSDGTVRGCLSLPPQFDEKKGNIRQRSLKEIWNDPGAFAYNRQFHVSQLEGSCKECAFGALCRAGCSSLAFSISGKTTENPSCIWKVRNS